MRSKGRLAQRLKKKTPSTRRGQRKNIHQYEEELEEKSPLTTRRQRQNDYASR